MNQYSFNADFDSVGERLDKWLFAKDLDLTRSAIQKMITEENITVNEKAVSKNYKLRLNDNVEVIVTDTTEFEIKAENISLDIVYEDSDLLVVNKPKGMVVHPAVGNYSGTLVNALKFHCKADLSSVNGEIRPGIVHRIDKNTSGLLIVAKNDFAHLFLAEQIKEHSFTREYQAICIGKFKEQSGTIDAPIGRDRRDRKKMRVTDENSRNAITHYEVIDFLNNTTLVKFNLETGRTHQIRVHSAYLGHSIYGDDVYGKRVSGVQGQCLHAKKIGFIHPTSKEYLEFDSELPEYFNKILNKLMLRD